MNRYTIRRNGTAIGTYAGATEAEALAAAQKNENLEEGLEVSDYTFEKVDQAPPAPAKEN